LFKSIDEKEAINHLLQFKKKLKLQYVAKFLTTTATSFHIEDIIINAEKSITLITPYLKLNNLIVQRLKDADKQNILITIVYGKDELQDTQKRIISELKNIEIFFCQNLHAKCYFNENHMIVSSMNLFEFSERNNREMSILIEKQTDFEIYNDTLKEVQSIKNASQQEKKIINSLNNHSTIKHQYFATFNEPWNFFIPSLFEKLKTAYPQKTEMSGEEIIMKNFPANNITVEISSRIDLRFHDAMLYTFYKTNYKQKLNSAMPSTRLYWNYNILNIYPPKNVEVPFNDIGKKMMSDYFVKVIEIIISNCC